MKVKMRVSLKTADYEYSPGQIVEIADEVAEKWCDGGLAEPVVEEQKPAAKPKEKAGEDDGTETADTASKRTGKRK